MIQIDFTVSIFFAIDWIFKIKSTIPIIVTTFCDT